MTTSHAAWGPPCRPPHPLLFPTAFILRPRLCNRQRKSSARGVPSATLMKSTLVISNYCSHEAHQMFLGGLSLTALLPPLPIPSFSLSRRSADLLHPSRSTKVFELPICRRGPRLILLGERAFRERTTERPCLCTFAAQHLYWQHAMVMMIRRTRGSENHPHDGLNRGILGFPQPAQPRAEHAQEHHTHVHSPTLVAHHAPQNLPKD